LKRDKEDLRKFLDNAYNEKRKMEVEMMVEVSKHRGVIMNRVVAELMLKEWRPAGKRYWWM
jgi:hypothetical protein